MISQIMVAQGCDIAEKSLVAQRHNISEGQSFPPHIMRVPAFLSLNKKEGRSIVPASSMGEASCRVTEKLDNT